MKEKNAIYNPLQRVYFGADQGDQSPSPYGGCPLKGQAPTQSVSFKKSISHPPYWRGNAHHKEELNPTMLENGWYPPVVKQSRPSRIRVSFPWSPKPWWFGEKDVGLGNKEVITQGLALGSLNEDHNLPLTIFCYLVISEIQPQTKKK